MKSVTARPKGWVELSHNYVDFSDGSLREEEFLVRRLCNKVIFSNAEEDEGCGSNRGGSAYDDVGSTRQIGFYPGQKSAIRFHFHLVGSVWGWGDVDRTYPTER